MKANLTRGIIGLVLGGVLITGLTPGSIAQASPQFGRDEQVRWDKDREKRFAYLLGYHTSYSEARDSRGSRVNYKDMQGYRDGMNGWKSWMGTRENYRDSYRKGYEEGFKDGQNGRTRRYDRDDVEQVLGDSLKRVYDDDRDYDFDRGRGIGRGRDQGDHDRGRGRDDRGQFGRDDIYQLAQRNGYRDGFHHGREDRNRRRGYDYDHADRYRNATNGYRGEYGDRELYRRGYRDGYREGYDDGFRGRNDRSFRGF